VAQRRSRLFVSANGVHPSWQGPAQIGDIEATIATARFLLLNSGPFKDETETRDNHYPNQKQKTEKTDTED